MRDEIKKRILKRIAAFQDGYRQNLGLLGRSGVGKTTLITELLHKVEDQSSLIPVYVYAPSLDPSNLFEKWSTSLLRGLFTSQSVMPPSGLDSLILAADPIVPKAVEKIRQLRRTLSRDHHLPTKDLFHLAALIAEETGKKILFILEEVQVLSEILDGDVFGALGKEIMLEKSTLYLFTSSNPVLAQEILRDKLALLFNNFEVLHLDAYSPNEGIQAIRRSLSDLCLPYWQMRFLLSLTGSHPFYLHQVLQRLSNVLITSTPQSSITEDLADQYLFKLGRALTLELFGALSPLSVYFEKKLETALTHIKESHLALRAALAVSEGYYKASEVAMVLDRKVFEVKKILDRLVDLDLISQNGTIYFYHDVMFGSWIQEVYRKRFSNGSPMVGGEEKEFETSLIQKYRQFRSWNSSAPEARLETLLKQFHNDRFDLEGKKYRLPPFSEFNRVSLLQGTPLLVARSRDLRWVFQLYDRKIEEKDISSFLIHAKNLNKRIQKKIIIALNGVEANARLLAHELKIQIWEMRDYNKLMRLGRLPEVIEPMIEELNETTLGALADQLHTA